MGPGVLSDLLEGIEVIEDENVILDFTSKDDASVYKLGDNYLFQTLDFFTPNVDDPYIFGQIVAANSLSDIYAMGANPVTCQSIVAFPEHEDINVLKEMTKGCSSKLKEANVSLTGGHSIYDETIKYGLSVLGIGDKIWKNNSIKENDILILTKPIGTGVIMAAKNSFDVSDDTLEKCYRAMTTLNKYAKEVIEDYPINSCTDITGFGLLGHLFEMIDKTNFSAKINVRDINILDDAIYFSKNYVYTSSAQQNRKYLDKKIKFIDIDSSIQEILFDAQTSGGLLFSVNKSDGFEIIEKLNNENIEASIIGEIVKSNKNIIEVYNENI
ncbi:MAG: selenide, water dikinase SelD [Bacilli bacterium]